MLTIVLIAAAVATMPVSDSEIAKGLENLRNIHAAAQMLDFRAAMGTTPDFDPAFADPWGTPYRIDIEKGRIVGAGSDRIFDESNWDTYEQFEGTDGDAVFQKGAMWRSNRNWLAARATTKESSGAELEALRTAETQLMIMRTPQMRQITALRMSAMAMRAISGLAERYRVSRGGFSQLASASDPASQLISELKGNPRLLTDAWGTPLRLILVGDTHRVISAGADRRFDPESWNQPVKHDAAEDVVLENGAFVRHFDERALLEQSPPVVEPLAQPPDPPLAEVQDSTWSRVGGDVKAPVVVERVPPMYPNEYRTLRLSGILIVEVAISETGDVTGVRVLKSLAPDMDMAGVEAVRQWKFKPATLNDKPVPVLFNLTINFKLK